MTFPITPDPSIHNSDAATSKTPNPSTLLTGQFANFPGQIIGQIVNTILGAFGLQSVTGVVHDLLAALASAMSNIPIIGPLLAAAFNSVMSVFPVGNTPVAGVTSQDTSNNLIFNGAFDTAGSLASNPDWSWDSSTDHTGRSGSGAAKTTANGNPLTLLSNSIGVSSGQNLNISGWVKWTGLLYTAGASPISLGLQTYDSTGAIVASPVIQALAQPAGAGGWTQLSGSYTIPTGISTVTVALNVTAAATAGIVWFDDLSATVVGSQLISTVTGGQHDTTAGFGGFFSDILNMLGNPLGLGSPSSSAATSPSSIVANPLGALGQLVGNIIATPLNLFAALFGAFVPPAPASTPASSTTNTSNTTTSGGIVDNTTTTTTTAASPATQAPSWLTQLFNSTNGTVNALNLFQQLLNIGTSAVAPNANSLVAFFQQILGVSGGATGNAAVVSLMQGFLPSGTTANANPLTAIQQVLNSTSASNALIAYLQGQVTSNASLLTAAFQGIMGGGNTGIVSNSSFNQPAALRGMLSNLLPAGAIASTTPVPANLLSALHPGTTNNVLPNNGGFPTSGVIDGQGLWLWDWPGAAGGNWGSPGCVRTRRPGLITIFFVPGTFELFPGMGGQVGGNPMTLLQTYSSHIIYNQALTSYTLGENLLDWTHFEWVNIEYEGAEYPMGQSVQQGVTALISAINSIPGPFILFGVSQGGMIASNVYDEIRYGSLKNRNKDLLMGLCIGNMRRQQGRTFPNGPLYCPQGYGVFTPTLQNTEDRWWEWSTAAGTYPAFNSPTGVTYTAADPISCCGTDPTSNQLRSLVAQSMAATSFNLFQVPGLLFQALTQTGGQQLFLGGAGVQNHGTSFAVVQPFLANGDDRTFHQYAFSAINALAGDVTPPANGIRHQLLGVPTAVTPLQVIIAGAQVQWTNVVASGPAILIGVNAYDSNGNLILAPGGSSPTVTATQATISNPQPNSGGWVQLQADFVMPPGAATACLVLDVEPQAMTTGIVWFDQCIFEVTSLVDSALLANLQNIPTVPALNVQGAQGIADMLTSIQNVLDGLGSANTANNLSGVQLSDMFAAQGDTAVNAGLALELAVLHNQQLGTVTNQPVYNGLQPTGLVTIPLGTAQGTTLPTTAVAAGNAVMGFINCPQATTMGFLEFIAEGTGGTGVYVNVYQVNTLTGNMTNVYSTADISSSIPNGSFGYVAVTIANGIKVTASELLALEIVSQGTATTIVTPGNTALPNHANLIPQNQGASRVTASTGGISPASLSQAQITPTGNCPFISLNVANIPATYQPPNQTIYSSAGTYTFQIPAYVISDFNNHSTADLIDIVAVGGGHAGSDLGPLFGGDGPGGLPGSWATQTLVYGTDIATNVTQLTVIVGAGGTANSSNGNPGGNSSVSGARSFINAAGGTGLNTSPSGLGPGFQPYQNRTYFGGHTVAGGQMGSGPGGGGGGGTAGFFGTGAVTPGAGADGMVVITVRQP